MLVQVSVGDVLDRITILRLKVERIEGPGRDHAARELAVLEAAWAEAGHGEQPEESKLYEINGILWSVEDGLRECEARGEFGPAFVGLARSVYRLNDERAALKRQVNRNTGSELVEVKSYGG